MTTPPPGPPDLDPYVLTDLPRVNAALSKQWDEVDPEVAEAVDAVVSLVPTWLDPRGDLDPATGRRAWAKHQQYGGKLLAARLYRLRDTPGGGMAEFGVDSAGYVQSNWQDIAMLLDLGKYAVGRPG